jgi:hypothetical protein
VALVRQTLSFGLAADDEKHVTAIAVIDFSTDAAHIGF